MAVLTGHDESGFCTVQSKSLLGTKENKRRGGGENKSRKCFKESYSKWKQKHATMIGGKEGSTKHFKNVIYQSPMLRWSKREKKPNEEGKQNCCRDASE